mgnify:FL=1
MIITYHGKQFFKIQQGDLTIAVNPLAKDNPAGLPTTKFGADVTLCSVRHPNYDGFDMTEYNGNEPFKIYGPGNYEVKDNTYVGHGSKALIDGKEYLNTIYFFKAEGISFCFIGDLHSPDIDQKTKEHIESVDVIFVPIGGEGTLSPQEAAKVLKFFSPKIIIPMDYGKDRDPATLEVFKKEMSSSPAPIEKYVFKKSDLDPLTSHVVILEAQ